MTVHSPLFFGKIVKIGARFLRSYERIGDCKQSMKDASNVFVCNETFMMYLHWSLLLSWQEQRRPKREELNPVCVAWSPLVYGYPSPSPPPPHYSGWVSIYSLGWRWGKVSYLTGTNNLTTMPEPAPTNRPATTPPRLFKRDAILQTGIELLISTPWRTHFWPYILQWPFKIRSKTTIHSTSIRFLNCSVS